MNCTECIDKEIADSLKEKKKGSTPPIPVLPILAAELANGLPTGDTSIKAFLLRLKERTQRIYNYKKHSCPDLQIEVPKNFNNPNGQWSEALFLITIWNLLADYNKKHPNEQLICINIPDRTNYENEWTTLLDKKCLISYKNFNLDSSNPIVASSDHKELILRSSNPDSIVLKLDKSVIKSLKLPFKPTEKISSISCNQLEEFLNIFSSLKNKITPSKNLIAILTEKNSLRSDRRYQFVHEGDNIKSILMYLYIMKSDKGLTTKFFNNRFYAIVFDTITNEDIKIEDIAMSACVSSPIMEPVWAIDKIYSCLTFSDIESTFKEILCKSTSNNISL